MTRLPIVHSKVLKPLALLMACMISSLLLTAQAQPRTGKVTDENGAPLSNVSVTIKNAAGGTTTNAQGIFSINVAAGAVLVFFAAVKKNVNTQVGSEVRREDA